MIGTPKHGSASEFDAVSPPRKPRLTTSDVVITVTSVVTLCAKCTSRAAKKLKAKVITATSAAKANDINRRRNKQPMTAAGAKKLISTVSNKAITFVHKSKKKGKEEEEEEIGDGGVWQKTILMGDKCQPLDFSGVIYYDGKGHQLTEVPLRSPRASPLPSYLLK